MRKLIAGNWKMYKTMAEASAFVAAVNDKITDHSTVDLLVFAQAPMLSLLKKEAKPGLHFGPQSIYWEEKGAFTGELSPMLAKELGAGFALAGHSERRQFFGESSETAAKRALAAHKFGMKAVFCLGESLAERDAGKTNEVIGAQCAALFQLATKGPEGFCFAYEPVWAIGTGRTATSAQAQEAHDFLRQEIKKAWGSEYAQNCRLLYGGSVKLENAKELMSQPDVDGVLVGGASLEPASFLAIAAAGKQ